MRSQKRVIRWIRVGRPGCRGSARAGKNGRVNPSDAHQAPTVVPLPAGFRAHAGAAGLRDQGDDVFVAVADGPSVASSAVFTRSLFAGPSVIAWYLGLLGVGSV